MSELDNKITQLISSADVGAETRNAELANEFANENKLSYSISVKSLENGETVPMSQIESYMNKKLQVSIQSDGNTFTWEPKNNENIFLLLRE